MSKARVPVVHEVGADRASANATGQAVAVECADIFQGVRKVPERSQGKPAGPRRIDGRRHAVGLAGLELFHFVAPVR